MKCKDGWVSEKMNRVVEDVSFKPICLIAIIEVIIMTVFYCVSSPNWNTLLYLSGWTLWLVSLIVYKIRK